MNGTPVLNGKNAVVFGAGGSIGAAVAKEFAKEGARVFLAGRTKASLDVAAERGVDGCKEIVAGGARVYLAVDFGKLRRGEFATLDVDHQPLNAAGNVAQMEANGTEAMRAGPELFSGEAFGVLRQILARLLEGIEERREEGVDAWDRAS